MDPSYDSSGQNATGNSGIPGAKPGVIASGPDTPSAEVPVLDVGTDAQNPNGIFAGLSRRPTGGRPVGNRMNSGPITPQPIDKVTSGGGQRQSRRGLLIAGIALIGVALIAGVVALLVMRGGNSNGNTDGISVKDAYSDVAKYMYFGDVNSETAFSEVTLDTAKFASIATVGNYDEETAFFDNLRQYIGILENAIVNNSTLLDEVVDLKDALIMLEILSKIAYANTLWPNYLENGKSAIQEYLDGVNSVSTDDEFYLAMLEMERLLIEKTGELYQVYSQRGCITNKTANDECINAVVTGDENAKTLQREMYNLRYNICQYIPTLTRTIFTMSETLNREILGE